MSHFKDEHYQGAALQHLTYTRMYIIATYLKKYPCVDVDEWLCDYQYVSTDQYKCWRYKEDIDFL